MLGEDPPPARCADLMAGPADALETGCDRTGRCHLDHQIDRSHVDAELERAGGDQPAEVAPLELVLDLETPLPRERAVVGLHELVTLGRGETGLLVADVARPRVGIGGGAIGAVGAVGAVRPHLGRQLVEAARQPLRQAPGVDEHQRRVVLLDEAEELGMHGRPDRRPGRCRGGRATGLGDLDDLAECPHVVDRHHHLEIELLGDAGVDDPNRSRSTGAPTGRNGEPTQVLGHHLERSLGGGQADPLDHRPAARLDGPLPPIDEQALQSLEAQREMGAPLGLCQGVDLVDDHAVDSEERLARRRREHQVQRFRCGDQDVGRCADESPTLVRAGVTGADTDGRFDEGLTEPLCGHADAPQWCPEVLVDIDGQGPQRGDVQHPDPGVGPGCPTQRIDRPQEGRQGLSGAGGSAEQCVLARRDGPPSPGLGTGRRLERRLEPGPNRVGELRERNVGHETGSVPTARDIELWRSTPTVNPARNTRRPTVTDKWLTSR